MNEWFVRTALYRYANSKSTPIICFLLRTTFHFGVVIKGCRCVVSSVNCMMLFLHLCWFGFALIKFTVWFCPLCLSSVSLVIWVSYDILFHFLHAVLSFYLFVYFLIQRKMVEREHVWSCQCTNVHYDHFSWIKYGLWKWKWVWKSHNYCENIEY